jgi:hypothetical protein
MLGPLSLDVPGLALTSMYAMRSPPNGSMDLVVHQVQLPTRGSDAPDNINSGSADLAAGCFPLRLASRELLVPVSAWSWPW